MKITAIKAQVKRVGRYSVFVDEKYSFSLSDTALLNEKIVPGQELEAGEVKRLKQLSADDKVYGNILRYVMIRPRSQWEIRDYLKRKDASPALADDILKKLNNNGFVDDVKFATAWVDNRRLHRPTSMRKLQQELRAKRVPDAVIEQVLHDDTVDEQAVLRELITKKRARYPDQQKFMQYLARQGFNYSDIKSVLEEIDQ